MKLIDINKKLSDDYKDIIIFMKFGNFYRCFYNNALVMNYIFDYKLNDNRVGFPINIINEVIDKLNNLNIDYLIYNNEFSVTYNYFENNNYNENLEKGIIKNNLILKQKELSDIINYLLNKDINNYRLIRDKLNEL